jgi:hypothetical protein
MRRAGVPGSALPSTAVLSSPDRHERWPAAKLTPDKKMAPVRAISVRRNGARKIDKTWAADDLTGW